VTKSLCARGFLHVLMRNFCVRKKRNTRLNIFDGYRCRLCYGPLHEKTRQRELTGLMFQIVNDALIVTP
jgi:hypothetical protein